MFRERRREGERGKEKHWCARGIQFGCLFHAANQGPGPHPRHVPWPGIELVAFKFTGCYLVHWVTPARVISAYLLFRVSCPQNIENKKALYNCIYFYSCILLLPLSNWWPVLKLQWLRAEGMEKVGCGLHLRDNLSLAFSSVKWRKSIFLGNG